MITTLNNIENQILLYFKNKITKKFPNNKIKLFLFGSKARGDSNNESDIDLLIIINSDNWKLRDQIRKIGYKLDESLDYKLSILVIPEARFNFMKKNNFQFSRNILKDGIEIK